MNENNKQSNKICERCNVKMTLIKVQFSYLNRSFSHEVPRCPSCGQVFISEELASGRIHDVETALEDK